MKKNKKILNQIRFLRNNLMKILERGKRAYQTESKLSKNFIPGQFDQEKNVKFLKSDINPEKSLLTRIRFMQLSTTGCPIFVC